jgi:hypothetical protein
MSAPLHGVNRRGEMSDAWEDDYYGNVSKLLGLTLKSVRNDANERIEFETDTGRKFSMWHDQDCCESVTIEDIVGDLNDLVGAPILLAEQVTSEKPPEGYTPEYEPESQTWTFYKFATIKGSVTIRWYGTSNGYYSERVRFSEKEE